MYDCKRTDMNGTEESLGTWLRDLVRHPVRPAGDYFDRLRANVEASAPVCTACG